jgi:F420-dependent oxidoreductase-like protein
MALRFGLILPQGALEEWAGIDDPVGAYETMTRMAKVAEEGGFTSVWLSDVLWPGTFSGVAQPSQAFLFECWTTTAALARDTQRVRIGQTVTYSGLRQPALLAKMASTVDVLSHGRLTLGIGSGSPSLASQFRAYGYDYPDLPIRSGQLREALQILRAMWTQDEVSYDGRYYQVRGAINQPKGVQHPHIPLLIGGNGEQVTLKLVAQYGDACNVFGDPATITRKFAALRGHCEAVGRDYQSIHRTAGTYCIIEETDEQAQAQAPAAVKALFGSAALIGSLATIRERIAAFEDAGVQELLIRVPEAGQLETVRRFAQEIIAPGV